MIIPTKYPANCNFGLMKTKTYWICDRDSWNSGIFGISHRSCFYWSYFWIWISIKTFVQTKINRNVLCKSFQTEITTSYYYFWVIAYMFYFGTKRWKWDILALLKNIYTVVLLVSVFMAINFDYYHQQFCFLQSYVIIQMISLLFLGSFFFKDKIVSCQVTESCRF